MRPYLPLGSVPYREPATPADDPNYRTNAIRECKAYIQAIRNYLGAEPDNVELKVELVPDDRGGQYEAVVFYDPNNPASVAAARSIERQAPQTWEDGSVPPPDLEGRLARFLGRPVAARIAEGYAPFGSGVLGR